MNLAKKDPRSRFYITPVKVVWQSEDVHASVERAEALLEPRDGQATLVQEHGCTLRNRGEGVAGILFDFGIELQGGVQLCIWSASDRKKTARMRIRFGESAMEAMSELGGAGNAGNDHAIRDQVVEVCTFLGATEVGNSGFRFVRIDLLEPNTEVKLKSIRAVNILRDLEYKGSFRCSDPLLEQIWHTGAYTVHLNMQDYLWDGIKRDRLVWVGDLHPEIAVLSAVFGHQDIVPQSLDVIRDNTPLPAWMNTIASYSIWWILIQHDWYMQHGRLDYLREQSDYLLGLLRLVEEHVGEDGRFAQEHPFLDWPTKSNQVGSYAGVHGLLILAMQAGAQLCALLGQSAGQQLCRELEQRLRRHVPEHGGSKQAGALLALAGVVDLGEMNRQLLAVDGSRGLSTFLGYYVLKARGEAGDIVGSLNCIREYWGGMLSLGATTFWEHFDTDWLDHAARIDELTPAGKVDVHGHYGDHCYQGYRHSLCHGWAAGPTVWLAEYVLGIRVKEPGGRTIAIRPSLGDLDWAEGSYPTAYGIVHVRHDKRPDGSMATSVRAPEGVTVLRE